MGDPRMTYPRHQPCPACGEPVLVVYISRHGGELLALDPEPAAGGGHYDVRLSEDRSHIASEGLAGLPASVPLYRNHLWSCPQGLRVPVTRTLPGIRGYTHRPVTKERQ